MIKLLFVCHGNICRSPMAEFVMKNIVNESGISDNFYIESAATSTEEIGNPVYPPVKALLAKHGIGCKGKTARQITLDDYDKFDLIIGMDSENYRNMLRVFRNDPDDKVHLLMSYAGLDRDVADPWYTRNFEDTWNDVNEGCKALLESLGF